MFNLSLERVREAFVMLIALVLSIAVHEFGHALLADRFGDRTPRSQGRVTLNPFVHADPIGTLLFPLIGLLFGGGIFGWGRPVQVNPAAFTRRLRMKTAHMFVALAGPAMNVVLAILLTIVYGLLLRFGVLSPLSPIGSGVAHVIYLNWILAFFNLIPCPPLDGGTILAGFLPDRHYRVLEFLNRYGFIILLGLLFTGATRFFLAPAGWMASICLSWAVAL